MRLKVELPSWLIGYAVQCVTSWDASGTGAKLAVTIPRAIDMTHVLRLSFAGDFYLLPDFLAKKAILPTDVNASDGQPFLLVSL